LVREARDDVCGVWFYRICILKYIIVLQVNSCKKMQTFDEKILTQKPQSSQKKKYKEQTI